MAFLIAFVIVGVIIVGGVMAANHEVKENIVDSHVISEDGTLTLSREIMPYFNIKKLQIINDQNCKVSYEPEKYVYTSVTLGGFTSGSIDKIGGYDYISGSYDNGKCTLRYGGKTVYSIKLDGKYLRDAQNDKKMLEYLDSEKRKIIVIHHVFDESAFLNLATANNSNFNSNLANFVNSSKKGYPDFKKCKKILDWIYEVTQKYD